MVQYFSFIIFATGMNYVYVYNNYIIKVYHITALPRNEVIIAEEEQFLINQPKQLKSACVEHLSVTSFDTYTKNEPQIQNSSDPKNDTEKNYETNISMYPIMSNTDDDNENDYDDDDDDEFESCRQFFSDYDQLMPGTIAPSTDHQYYGTINCYHPTKYSRQQ